MEISSNLHRDLIGLKSELILVVKLLKVIEHTVNHNQLEGNLA